MPKNIMNMPTATPFIQRLNQADLAGFTASLGAIFEHSPWIAARAWEQRPFQDREALFLALQAVLAAASPEEQLQLIRSHPELAGKEAAAGTLTAASAQEQHGAGLNCCSPEELARLGQLNRAYRERFGFPFVIAVKGLGKADILAALEQRLQGERETEFRTCLEQICRIGAFRLAGLEAAS